MQTFDIERMGLTSASNAHADELCAGRHLAQLGIEEKCGDSASFGNDVHEAMWNDEAMSRLNQFQASIVRRAKSVEKEVFTNLIGQYNESDVVREKRLWLTYRKRKIHSGKPDALIIKDGVAVIEDLKSLSGDVVESDKNKQLSDLSVLLHESNNNIKTIYAFINQPLKTGILVAKFDVKSIKKIKKNLLNRIRASNNPNSTRVAGNIQCEHCRAKFTCKEHIEWSKSRGNEIEVANKSESIVSYDKKIDYYFQCKKLYKACGEYIERFNKSLKENPDLYPDFRVEDCLGDREVIDPQGFYNSISDVIGHDLLMSTIKMPIGKFEELFVDEYIKINQDSTREKARSVFSIKTQNYISRKREKKITYEPRNKGEKTIKGSSTT